MPDTVCGRRQRCARDDAVGQHGVGGNFESRSFVVSSISDRSTSRSVVRYGNLFRVSRHDRLRATLPKLSDSLSERDGYQN